MPSDSNADSEDCVYVLADLDGDGILQPNERLLREVLSGSSSLDLEFGLGLGTSAMVEVLWPSGRREQLIVSADQFLALTELLGDFDQDGDVDSADLANWQVGFGMSSGALHTNGDTDQDGDVDGVDFLNWQRNIGKSTLSSLPSAATAVPEPTTLTLVLLTCLWPQRFRTHVPRKRL